MRQEAASLVVLNPASILSRYTWAVAAVTVIAALLVLALGPPTPASSAMIMLAAVALIGLPHGAYDLEVARLIFSDRLGKTWWLLFAAGYLALAVLALGLWVTAPWLGLSLLLIGGAIHWGLDDLECRQISGMAKTWLALSRGGIPIAGPMLFHPADVAGIFTTLLGSSSLSASTVSMIAVWWITLAIPGIIASVVWTSATSPMSRLRVFIEPVVLTGWFFVTPPILAFTLYFCQWHSVRHSLRSAIAATPNLRLRQALFTYIRASAIPTALTWILAGLLALLWIGSKDAVTVTWSVVFIGLFALTVPHVVLEWLESNHNRRVSLENH